MVRHLFQHSGERPFRCQNCESGFTSINRLKEHIKKKHPDTPAAQSIMDSPIVGVTSSTPPITTSISTNSNISTQSNSTLTMTSKSKYTPIAPAPAKITTATPTIMLPAQPACQNLPILTQGPNGTMLLVSSATPTFATAAPFMLPTATPTPWLFTTPQIQNPFIYGMPSFFQPQVQNLSATPTATTPLSTSFWPTTSTNTVAAATPPSSTSTSKDEITVLNEKGESQKYDILERAILEIPNIEEVSKQV